MAQGNAKWTVIWFSFFIYLQLLYTNIVNKNISSFTNRVLNKTASKGQYILVLQNYKR